MSSGIGGPSSFVYGGGWVRALLLALLLSWGMMNAIAFAAEERTMLRPGQQFKSYYFGDLVCLPVIVLMIWYLGYRMPEGPNLTNESWWNWVCLGTGIAFAIGIRIAEVKTHQFTHAQFVSPTKMYHDFIVMPVYIYIIAVAGIPALFTSHGGIWPRVVITVMAVAFFCLVAYDGKHKPSGAHVGFDWHSMEPTRE